ncbi:MAG: chorismate synthase [Oscillospiraceae bacterium]|nr:chorismate synthase [Oscillospiraceae bacterium]
MGSCYGRNFRVQIFGQSHSAAIGVVIDGLPAGTAIDIDELRVFMKRRAPGQSAISTARREADEPEFLSGLVDGTTCGAPIAIMIRNKDTRSDDYRELRDIPRPSHADYSAHIKYKGYQDVAGGGHFSGRLTAPLCAAGGICLQILRNIGITVTSRVTQVGQAMNITDIREAEKEILNAKKDGDSVGGVIECVINGVPAGLGTPMFDGIENKIAAIVFGIPGVKGVEFGNGFAAVGLRGSENNDSFYMDGDTVKTRTNNSGGILGGITNGMPIVFRAAIKPTPSIGIEQKSVSLSKGEDTVLQVKGRHDPCIVPRAIPCIEAAAAIAIYDAYLEK